MLKRIIQTIYFLIAAPQKGWRRVLTRRSTQQEFMNDFLFPIFGLIALTTFIGAMWAASDGNIQYALKKMMVVSAALFGAFYAASYAVDKLYLKYEQMKDSQLVQQFVGYSSSVIYLLFLVMPLLPGFEILWLFILYTFYLVYSGVTLFLNIPEKEKTVFTLSSFVVITFTPVLLNFLLSFVVM